MTVGAAETADEDRAAGNRSQDAPLGGEVVRASAKAKGTRRHPVKAGIFPNVPLTRPAVSRHVAGFLRMAPIMKVAVPVWNGRVSPVFDVAKHFRVFDVRGGTIEAVSIQIIENDGRVGTMWKLGVDVVICAGISHKLEAGLWVAGIKAIPNICGPVDKVIDAYVRGVLAEGAYFSPCLSDRSSELRSPPSRRRGLPVLRKEQAG